MQLGTAQELKTDLAERRFEALAEEKGRKDLSLAPLSWTKTGRTDL